VPLTVKGPGTPVGQSHVQLDGRVNDTIWNIHAANPDWLEQLHHRLYSFSFEKTV
jgi:hypothetical protein